MACPYFHPTNALSWANWQGKLRPSLGEFYNGKCRASGAVAFSPGTSLLEQCNLGYAAGVCPHFPKSKGPDAVRFVVSSDHADLIRIIYCYERTHLPYRHGVHEYKYAGGRWEEPDTGSLQQQQAKAYLHSYLRWKKSQPVSNVKPGKARITSVRKTLQHLPENEPFHGS